jgi:hypothetical protein
MPRRSGGFFAGSTKSNDVNPTALPLSPASSAFSRSKRPNKLREIFDTAFRVAPGYGDDARSTYRHSKAAKPANLSAGELKIVLVGSGFISGTVVRVAQVGGPDVPRDVAYQSAQRLEVTLEAEDVKQPGVLMFTAMNLSPGGGTSTPLSVEVTAGGDPGSH